jgi:hypothetical protein
MKPVNRVLLAFQTWDEKKNELQPLLKNSDERILELLKLQHLRNATHRLRQIVRPDEQPFMALLHNHVARLEKKLYPNLLQRVWLRLKDRFIDDPAYLQREMQQRAANMEYLKAQLKDKGLGSIAGELEKHLNPDHKQVCLPLDCQLGPDKRLNFDAHFEKDVYGYFQLTRLYGCLLEKGNFTSEFEFELKVWPGLKANQAWSLLEGRALKQTYTDATGHENQRWVQLGPDGAQHFAPELAFDVEKLIAGIPSLGGSKPEMIRYLENGQRAPALWKVDRKYQSISVQADPANGNLKFFDEKQRPVTPGQLNERAEKQAPGVKTLGIPVQKMRKGVKNGHRI